LVCGVLLRFTTPVQLLANKYGPQALQIATTVKLARVMDYSRCFDYCNIFKNKTTKIKIPYFIALFILAMILNTYLPQTALVAPYLVSLAKTGLTVTFFLIGLSATVLKSVGIKPLLQGVLFWACMP
jgi:uncharacterized membrane protein YadS